ncbi:TrkH family potassium uptake protein [Marinimicrococcus flavescens]|uniref:Trk system potassium uptake protein n=1 Tax=Marinimicrococcus flavescens TaxID=3031815 RepID=A0AAP3UZL4_9PROT|nr:TrkH family potassium uptake protein [Marinimicrococcus flavescens]
MAARAAGRGLLGIETVLVAIGWLLVVLALSMLLPMIADLFQDHPDWTGFLASSGISLFSGVALLLACRRDSGPLDLRAAFLLTTLTWVAVAAFGSLPFQLGAVDLSLTDAVFETVSGLTTTGSTVMTGLDTAPRGILLWRSILQLLGGIGIVVVALVMLPFLRVGGMQLFRTESSDRSEKLLPHTGAMVSRLLTVYLGLALLCILALRACGLSLFDAVNHAFTAVSTGGFGTRDASIGAFANPAAEWVLVLFMFLGALPFMRYVAVLQGRPDMFWNDSQIRLLLGICAVAALALALWLVLARDRSLLDALRAAAFTVVSVITTTGFATEDYQLWGAPPIAVVLALTIMGGCTGSTAGGIKMFRFEILWISATLYVQSLILPSRVTRPHYAGRPVDSEIIVAVLSFAFFFMGTWGLFSVVLGALGLDLITAITAAATALANVGPGLGGIIGPAGNFLPLSDPVKWVLTLAMLMGRLEFFTILVLLHPAFWRR